MRRILAPWPSVFTMRALRAGTSVGSGEGVGLGTGVGVAGEGDGTTSGMPAGAGDAPGAAGDVPGLEGADGFGEAPGPDALPGVPGAAPGAGPCTTAVGAGRRSAPAAVQITNAPRTSIATIATGSARIKICRPVDCSWNRRQSSPSCCSTALPATYGPHSRSRDRREHA